MANEANPCLDEGIVRSVRDAEVGADCGLGHSPTYLARPWQVLYGDLQDLHWRPRQRACRRPDGSECFLHHEYKSEERVH